MVIENDAMLIKWFYMEIFSTFSSEIILISLWKIILFMWVYECILFNTSEYIIYMEFIWNIN